MTARVESIVFKIKKKLRIFEAGFSVDTPNEISISVDSPIEIVAKKRFSKKRSSFQQRK